MSGIITNQNPNQTTMYLWLGYKDMVRLSKRQYNQKAKMGDTSLNLTMIIMEGSALYVENTKNGLCSLG